MCPVSETSSRAVQTQTPTKTRQRAHRPRAYHTNYGSRRSLGPALPVHPLLLLELDCCLGCIVQRPLIRYEPLNFIARPSIQRRAMISLTRTHEVQFFVITVYRSNRDVWLTERATILG